jgi:hypothetical protein
MRALLKVRFVAAFAATLFFGNASIAQDVDEATALKKKVEELYKDRTIR